MSINTNPAEGMRDLLPQDVELRAYVTQTILDVYRKFGFTQLETPAVERINFLSSGEGGENEKMLFKILKRGSKLNFTELMEESQLVDLGLRYDLTVPLSRFYANNRGRLPSIFKSIQIGSVWRAERPQKGRFKQFTQCDIDIIGSPSPLCEMELILATAQALQALGFKNFTVRINDRRVLEALMNYCGFEDSQWGKVLIIFDKLDKIDASGVQEELEQAGFESAAIEKFMQVLTAVSGRQLATGELPALLPGVATEVVERLSTVIDTVRSLSQGNFAIHLDISLVRGMGYYTGQIFEIGVEGYQSSIAGGGRYDKMIGKILQGKVEVPACGFSIGFERVVSILEEQQFEKPGTVKKIAMLYDDEISSFEALLGEAHTLRAGGNVVSIEVQKKNTKKQLDDLAQLGFTGFAFYEEGKPLNVKELK